MARACVALALALAAFAAIVVPSLSFSALPSPHMALRRGCAAPRQGFFCTSGSRSLTFNQHQLKVVVRASLDGTIGGEVTLLKVVFEESSVEELRAWVRRFPFAAVLPVQPMSAFPSDTGVDVQFRKKPTSERMGKDGGLVISVQEGTGGGVEMRVARDTEGQVISKGFSEKLIVARLVADSRGLAPPVGRAIAVESAFPSI